MSNKLNGKNFVVGAVVGTVLGAAAALLFAPKSGRELRTDISEQYGKISGKTVELAETVSAKTQEIAKTVGGQTGALVDKAKDAAGSVVNEVKAWSLGRKETAGASNGDPVAVSAQPVSEAVEV